MANAIYCGICDEFVTKHGENAVGIRMSQIQVLLHMETKHLAEGQPSADQSKLNALNIELETLKAFQG